MIFTISEIYETDPIHVGDKIQTRTKEELQEFYVEATLNKIANKEFIVVAVDVDEFDESRVYTVNGTDIKLIDDDIAYVVRD